MSISVDNLRKQVGKWSLGSDKMLLKLLQDLDTSMQTQIRTLENDMQGLEQETNSLNYQLQNCFNSLMMLSSEQFIENRVYDEEEETGMKDTTDQKAPEESLVTKFTNSLANGLKALDFYAVPEEDEESDEEDESSSDSESGGEGKEKPEKKKKEKHVCTDIWNDRPLPYVIGTRAFLEDGPQVGLDIPDEGVSAPDSDSDGSEVSMAFSSSSSSSGSSSSSSSSDSDSDSDSSGSSDSNAAPRPPRQSRPRPAASDSDSGSDSDWARPVGRGGNSAPPGPPGPPGQSVGDSDSLFGDDGDDKASEGSAKHKKKRSHSRAEPEQDDDAGASMFAAPAEDDLFSGFGPGASSNKSKAAGLFSFAGGGGGGGMFADIDEDDGFGAPAFGETKKSGGGMFDDILGDDDDGGDLFADFGEPASTVPSTTDMFDDEPEPTFSAQPQASSGGGGLFDDLDDESAQPAAASRPTGKAAKPVRGLFDDSDDEPAAAPQKPKPKPAGSAISSSLFDDSGSDDGFSAPKPAPAKKAPKPSGSLFSASGDSDDDFLSAAPASSKAKPKPAGGGLFDDGSDDDLDFSKPVSAKKKPVIIKAAKPAIRPASSLFDDGSDDDILSAPSATTSKKAGGGLFDDSDDDDTSFAAPVKPKPTAQSAEAASSAGGGLFGDDDDAGGLFGSSAPVTKTQSTPASVGPQKPFGGVSMFGGGDPLAALGKKKAETKVKASRSALFGDSSDDDSSLGPAPAAPKPQPVAQAANASRGLFGDDDEDGDAPASTTQPSAGPKKPFGGVSMFGGGDPLAALGKKKAETKVEASRSALFGDSSDDDSSLGTAPAAPKPQPVAQAAKAVPSGGLFGDDDEDGVTPATTTQPSAGPKKPFGGVSMFGGDPLAALGKKNAVKAKSPAKPKASSLFADDSDEDSLLVGKPKPVAQAAKPVSSAGLFGDDDDSGGLFGATTAARPTAQPAPGPTASASTGTKKPFGGVSMFGGGDPLAALGKKTANKTASSSPAQQSTPGLMSFVLFWA
jgi:WASH complex subunit FAM21